MYVVISYHDLDNQCIPVWMADVTSVSITKSDIFHLASSLLGRPLVGRAHGRNRPFPGLSKVAVLGSSHLPGELRSAEDGSDFTRRSCLALVLMRLGAPVMDIILEVSLLDELLNLVFEGNAFFRGVADLAVYIQVPFRAVSPHRIRSFVHARVLHGQEYILTRPSQVSEVIVLGRRESRDPLIRALGLLLVGISRSSAISTFALLAIPFLLGGHKLSYWSGLMWRFYRS